MYIPSRKKINLNKLIHWPSRTTSGSNSYSIQYTQVLTPKEQNTFCLEKKFQLTLPLMKTSIEDEH